ncbi:MAG: tetratricopeptide repeat protein [Verrucomicrobiota bacterium]
MKGLFSAVCVVGLVSCSSFEDEAPPLAGSVQGASVEALNLFQKAQGFQAAGKTKSAIKTYKRVADRFPADKNADEARYMQAALLDGAGESLDAFDAYQQFIQRYPDSPRYSQALSRQEAVAHSTADGTIGTQFLGLKSDLAYKTIVGMLDKVRDNAPRAASAPKAQFAIGQVYESKKKVALAIDAYERLVSDYGTSGLAPEAQFRIGEILLRSARDGNQDQANLEQAKNAYSDLLLAYPSSVFASKAKERIATIGSKDLESSYKIAEFYRRKGQMASAAFYYQEVIDGSAPGELRNQAAAQLAKIQKAS